MSEIYGQVMVPTLVEIGDLWCAGTIGVGQEHLATQIVLADLDRLSSLFHVQERLPEYRVLVACIEGEQHYLGPRMFADLCKTYGWVVDFLEPDVPNAALIDVVKKRRPEVVAIGATMEQGLKPMSRLMDGLAEVETVPKLLLGGAAISRANGLLKRFSGRCEIARDISDGVEIVNGLFRANRPKTILKEYLVALGRRVRDLRSGKGWTQERLADAARVTRGYIVAVEGGKQNVSMDILVRLANALSVAPKSLLAGDG